MNYVPLETEITPNKISFNDKNLSKAFQPLNAEPITQST